MTPRLGGSLSKVTDRNVKNWHHCEPMWHCARSLFCLCFDLIFFKLSRVWKWKSDYIDTRFWKVDQKHWGHLWTAADGTCHNVAHGVKQNRQFLVWMLEEGAQGAARILFRLVCSNKVDGAKTPYGCLESGGVEQTPKEPPSHVSVYQF